ncbi:MAG: hypothetical protein JWR85_185 [Marmoricola sp.]|nr:hypothetical protein [Marmoricola sp.]
MRHRGQDTENSPSKRAAMTASESLGTITDLRSGRTTPGKHKAPVAMPQIPEQMLPTHDAVGAAVETPVEAPAEPAVLHTPVTRTKPDADVASAEVPETGRWKASHFPRVIAATLLAMAVGGATSLGVQYARSRTSDDFVSLVVGIVVVVILWAIMIASTPQVVSLKGSVLTVHNTSGSESFDLADGLQPVDVVGDPRTSHWAVLLHRPNNTTVVLRRNDVTAVELDPIVRHYRAVATQRHSDRDARFSR